MRTHPQPRTHLIKAHNLCQKGSNLQLVHILGINDASLELAKFFKPGTFLPKATTRAA